MQFFFSKPQLWSASEFTWHIGRGFEEFHDVLVLEHETMVAKGCWSVVLKQLLLCWSSCCCAEHVV